MVERLSAEDRGQLAYALARCKWPDGGVEGMPTTVTAAMCAEQIAPDLEAIVERIVAAAVAEERERIARRMLNSVDPLLPGHEVRMACVEITRDES